MVFKLYNNDSLPGNNLPVRNIIILRHFLSYCKNKLSKYYYTRLMEYFIKCLCPNFFFLLFFIQKISFLFSFLITFFLYSTHAGPNSGDISVIKADNHQAATVQTLGNPFKLVHKQKIPDVREKSLRFRPDDSFNPCLKSARLVLIDRLIVVKVLTCRKTTNLGCKPAEGRCRPNYSLVRSPGGTELVYTSKCVCATT